MPIFSPVLPICTFALLGGIVYLGFLASSVVLVFRRIILEFLMYEIKLHFSTFTLSNLKFLVPCKMVQSLWKTVWCFFFFSFLSQTCSSHTIQQLCYLALTPWFENICPHKNLHMGVYSSFIHNCQNLEATKMSFSKWMNKPKYIQSTEYYSVLKRNELSSYEKNERNWNEYN